MSPASPCPLPAPPDAVVHLADGGGGRRMRALLAEHIAPILGSAALRHDAAVLPALPPGHRPAISTDGFVVKPWAFPGGDIGQLAVFGTLNDLAMAGAAPLALSLALILEEGLPYADLDRVLRSVRQAADAAGIAVATGDTKVVGRGQADPLYLTTTGIGSVAPGVDIGPWRIRAGDALIVSGDVGRHGAAILSQREGLAFESPLLSDCALLWPQVSPLLSAGLPVACLRDATRGGLGATLDELSQASGLAFDVAEPNIPVHPLVSAACELTGLDPLFLANEGRFLLVLPAPAAAAAMALLHAAGAFPARIGTVTEGPPEVRLHGPFGGTRRLLLPAGEALPRIC